MNARDAAIVAVNAKHPSDYHHYPEECAEAASDVWEPLLRDALALIRRGVFPGIGKQRDDLVERLTEALNG